MKTEQEIKEYIEILEFALNNTFSLGLNAVIISRIEVVKEWLEYIAGLADNEVTNKIDDFLNSSRF